MTQTITVDQARKKLGKKAENMTDAQIKGLLDLLYSMSFRVVRSIANGERYAN